LPCFLDLVVEMTQGRVDRRPLLSNVLRERLIEMLERFERGKFFRSAIERARERVRDALARAVSIAIAPCAENDTLTNTSSGIPR
jgi:hypothetical protein